MSDTTGLPAAIMNLIQQHGGVSGILQQFQQGGFNGVVESWIGNGNNQSISPDQLGSVLDSHQVNQAASQSGLSVSDFLSQLSQHLPQTIDHLTPNGQMPSGGSWSDMAISFLRNRI